jgi:hypothetical protein
MPGSPALTQEVSPAAVVSGSIYAPQSDLVGSACQRGRRLHRQGLLLPLGDGVRRQRQSTVELLLLHAGRDPNMKWVWKNSDLLAMSYNDDTTE